MKPSEYKSVIRTALENEDHPSILALGPPGTAKTQIPVDLATEMGLECHVIRLTLINPTDIRGMAYIAEVSNSDGTKEKTALWAWPGMLPKNDGKRHIVLLDDITNTPTTIQACAYGMVLEKKAGEHDLSHCTFIATGNRIQDASGAYQVSGALLNRFLKVEVQPDLAECKEYAYSNGWDSNIPAFWSWKPDLLYAFDPSVVRKGEPFPSLRTWDMLDKLIKLYGLDTISYNIISGVIGEGAAIEFEAFVKLSNDLPDVQSIIDGEDIIIPKEKRSLVFALIGSLVGYCRVHESSKDIDAILSRLIEYSYHLSDDFAVLLVRDLVLLYSDRLIQLSAYTKWTSKFGSILFESVS